jgi:mannose-6-phosphate isomerase-like protein (cupin superfamily)
MISFASWLAEEGYSTDIEASTLRNTDYRRVLFSGSNLQLVVMAIPPGEDVGVETHQDHDQFIRIESGAGTAIMDGKKTALKDGMAIVVPAGTKHNVINTGKEVLKLYTVYGPPEHPDGTVEKTKDEEKKEGKIDK